MPRIRLLAIMITAALIAAACGSLNPESLAFVEEEQRPGKTVIRVATHVTNGLSDAIEEWEREHPTADVVVDLRTYDDHHTTLLDSDGSAADVIAFDVKYSPNFRNRTDLLTDLTPMGGAEFEGSALPWRWKQGRADDGTLVAIPTDVGGLALAYRSDLLGPALARRLELAQSWCDLIYVGDRYSDRTDEAFLPSADSLFEAAVGQATQQFHDDEGRLIHATNSAVQEAWDLAMHALGEAPLFGDPCPENIGIQRISANLGQFSAEWDEAMQTGSFAALIAGSTMLLRVQSTAPETAEDWALALVPGIVGNTTGTHLGVSAKSAKPALAYDLVSHLASSITQLESFREFGNFPANATLHTTPEIESYERSFFGDSEIGRLYAASVADYAPGPDGPEYRLILREFNSAVGRVASGNQSPQLAWDEALWRIDQFLS